MTSLKELKKLAEAATQGPWEVYFETGIAPMITTYTENKDGYRSLGKLVASWPCKKRQNFLDMEFVAAANPATILKLISALEKYEEALELHTYNHCQLEYECNCWACETLTQVQKIMEGK